MQLTKMNRRDQAVLRARLYCHANSTNPPDHGTEHVNIKVSFHFGFFIKQQKQYTGFVMLLVIAAIMINVIIIHTENNGGKLC